MAKLGTEKTLRQILAQTLINAGSTISDLTSAITIDMSTENSVDFTGVDSGTLFVSVSQDGIEYVITPTVVDAKHLSFTLTDVQASTLSAELPIAFCVYWKVSGDDKKTRVKYVVVG